MKQISTLHKVLSGLCLSLAIVSVSSAQYTKQTGVTYYEDTNYPRGFYTGPRTFNPFYWVWEDTYHVTQTQGSSSEPVPWTTPFATLTSGWTIGDVDVDDFGYLTVASGKAMIVTEYASQGYTDEIWKKDSDNSLYRRKRQEKLPYEITWTFIDWDN